MRGGGRATHRRPDGHGASRRAVVALVATAAVGVLLIGGIPAYAYLTDAKTGTALPITAGNLTATASAPTVGTTSIGSVTAGGRYVVRAGTPGMVPGVQAQTLTYTVTNTGSARAPASAAVRVLSTAITDSAAWTAIQPYLAVTAKIGSGTATPVTTSAAGIDATVTSTTAIQPQASTTVVLSFSIPATSGTTDLLATLQPYAGTGGLTIRSILTLQPQFTLSQVAVSAP
jgi:hypothetical protein